MPDETKLALTDCASHGLVRPVTFQAVRHCFLLLACAHFGCTKIKRIVTNSSIERRLNSGIQRGRDDDTKAYGAWTVLEFACCEPAIAFGPAESLDHKLCRIGFAIIVQISQSLRCIGGTLVAYLSDIKQFDAERHYIWIIGCRHDG